MDTNRQKKTTHARTHTPAPSRPDLFSRVYQHSARARRLHRVCGMGTPQSRFSLAHSPLIGTKFPVVLSFQAPSQPELRNQTNSFLFSLYTRLRLLYQKNCYTIYALLFSPVLRSTSSPAFLTKLGKNKAIPQSLGGNKRIGAIIPSPASTSGFPTSGKPVPSHSKT